MGRWTPHWREIVVHHSASKDGPHLDTDAIRRFHVEGRGWRDVGYHFLIEGIAREDVDGWQGRLLYHAIAGRPLTRWGAHCPGKNGTAIGVCFVGDFTNEPPPLAQLKVGADCIAGLLWTMGVAVAGSELLVRQHVTAHREHKMTACPGDAFPLLTLRAMIGDRLREL